jgi:hypothetical protein
LNYENSIMPTTNLKIRTIGKLFILFVWTVLLVGHAFGAQRNQPVRIGVLTDSWGPTPGVVGLRDGLKELGYVENQNFVIGVRFTQGDAAALPEAARKLKLPATTGVDISLSDFKGKKFVLIEFYGAAFVPT